jgi:hypothetical protein
LPSRKPAVARQHAVAENRADLSILGGEHDGRNAPTAADPHARRELGLAIAIDPAQIDPRAGLCDAAMSGPCCTQSPHQAPLTTNTCIERVKPDNISFCPAVSATRSYTACQPPARAGSLAIAGVVLASKEDLLELVSVDHRESSLRSKRTLSRDDLRVARRPPLLHPRGLRRGGARRVDDGRRRRRPARRSGEIGRRRAADLRRAHRGRADLACGSDRGEAESINRLANSSAWTSRALAAMRLERSSCAASAGRLLSLTSDSSWRVRAYCYAVLARRGIAIKPDLAAESDERVLRTIVRCRYALPAETIDRRIAAVEKSSRPLDAMLALEVLAALDRPEDKRIRERMDELLGRIVLRMSRTERASFRAASLRSPAAATRRATTAGASGTARSSRKPEYESAALVPCRTRGIASRRAEPHRVARSGRIRRLRALSGHGRGARWTLRS